MRLDFTVIIYLMSELHITDSNYNDKLFNTNSEARSAVEFLSDRLASDIVLLDLGTECSYTDYFIIASGETDRHLESMANELARNIRKKGTHLVHREGHGSGGWILVEFPGFIVHLFSRSQREHYRLEQLWRRAKEILRIQ